MSTADVIQKSGQVRSLSNNADVILGTAVVGILVLMIIPVPSILLDVFIATNITFSLIVILVATYILKPMEFSAVPSIVLLTTLFRLSLNVASTRIILLHGDEGTMAAGKVIKAFGSFVVGGNYFVGAIVFLILVIINFVVITKGAGRIAEVAARFTLDAMPGKQMSIDADLNAGLIDEQGARERRNAIAREADFYGAMDGASKFVRGDAIAGVIITLINIVGGFAIGVFQNGMSFYSAAQNYTLMTVGDGLVSQIPALIISTAAGIVVSRAGSEGSLGREIGSQIMMQPRAIAITACVLFGFSLVPKLPGIPFFILAATAGGAAYAASESKKRSAVDKSQVRKAKDKAPPLAERIEALPPLDLLSLEVGFGLIPLVDVEQNGELLDRIKAVRRQIAYEIGVIVAPIHIQDNLEIKPGEYSIKLKGHEIAKGELLLNHYLAMDPGTARDKIEGIKTKEPTYGLPAFWIKDSIKEKAVTMGYTVVDLPTVLTTHLSEVIRRHAHELLGRQEVEQLLDGLKETHPKVVEELVPNLLPLGAVVKVLQNLLIERVPVRDLPTILEALADWAPMSRDLSVLTEHVRQSMARTIVNLYVTPAGKIPLMTLDQSIETVFSESLQQTDQGTFVAIEPDIAEKIIKAVRRSLENFLAMNHQPVILCSAQLRPHFKKFVSRVSSSLVVLSYNEILNHVEIESLGVVGISDAD